MLASWSIVRSGVGRAFIAMRDSERAAEFRAQIEGDAARLAATRMTAAQVEELQRIHGALDKARQTPVAMLMRNTLRACGQPSGG